MTEIINYRSWIYYQKFQCNIKKNDLMIFEYYYYNNYNIT